MVMDVRKVEGTDEQGQPVTAYVISNGYDEDWQGCSAIRMAPASDDGRVALFEIEGKR